MWDYAIDTFYDTHVMAAAGETVEKIRVKRGEIRKVEAVPEEDAVITVPAGEKLKGVKVKTEIEELRAPVKKGQVVGVVKVYDGDEVVCERNLVAKETVKEGGFLSIFGIPDWMAPFVYTTIVLVALIILILFRMKKQADRKRRARSERRRRRA